MFFYTFGNKITRCIDCYVVLGVDKELVGQHGAGVQGARDEEIKADCCTTASSRSAGTG